ncbi:MAG: FecR domain-containing protein [Cyclobacteriaceae bacterium]|nr:FecR domain-containing protein [Cyclobacteriaceae bacterium]
MKKLDEHIESIITRKITSSITANEQVQLENWTAQSDANKKHFEHLEMIYLRAPQQASKNNPSLDIDLEWKKFKNNLDLAKGNSKSPVVWLKVAASIVIVSVLGYVVWVNQFSSNTLHVVAQNWGEVVVLPDGSQITLNKGAEVTYPKKFNSKIRSVSLQGEAFFEVTRNETKPFIVTLSQSKVEVLGTSFNINADTNNNKTEVVVNTGRVRFSNSTGSESVILTKGDKGTLIKSTSMLSTTINNDVNVMAWKTRKIVFNNMELDKVIKTINHLYDAQISFSTDIGINCNVTVSFENQSLEAVLSVLELTLDLKYKKSGDVIEITQTGC